MNNRPIIEYNVPRLKVFLDASNTGIGVINGNQIFYKNMNDKEVIYRMTTKNVMKQFLSNSQRKDIKKRTGFSFAEIENNNFRIYRNNRILRSPKYSHQESDASSAGDTSREIERSCGRRDVDVAAGCDGHDEESVFGRRRLICNTDWLTEMERQKLLKILAFQLT